MTRDDSPSATMVNRRMLRACVDIQHGSLGLNDKFSKPRTAGSASQHVKSNFLSAFDSLIRMDIHARSKALLQGQCSECIVYKILLGPPHPSRRTSASISGARSRVKHDGAVFPMG